MDLDNIIYIVIAVALAIINAIAQKKKKEAKQQASSRLKSANLVEEPVEIIAPDEPEKPSIVKLQDLFKEIANESFLEDEPVAVSEINAENKTTQIVFEGQKPSPLDAPVPAEKFYSRTEYVPLDIPEGAIDSIGEYDYNSEENSISSGAIGNVLTAKEETEKREKAYADSRKFFDPKKAIIYSEIIKPKYF